MARFRTRTRTEILERMIARVVSRTRYTDLHDGSVVKQQLAAVARELEDIHDQAAALLALFDPQKAEGEDLDAIAAVFSTLGLPSRRGAVRSTGTVTLTRNSGAAASTIPIRSVYAAPGGTGVPDVQVRTTVAATIGAGAPPVSAVVAVEAVLPGAAGNVAVSSITKIVTPLVGVDAVTNAVPFTNGEDEESDDELRARIWGYLWSLCRSTPRSLEILARTIGVAAHADLVQGAAVKVFEDPTAAVRRCIFSRIVEDDAFPGVSTLYIDDGQGFAGVPIAQLYKTTSNLNLVTGAVGGERRLTVPFWPLLVSALFALQKQTPPGGWVNLTEGADYTVNRSNGRIVLVTALAAADNVRASTMTHHCDLVRAVQYAVEGDPTDAETWPGFRGAGTIVYVRAPAAVTVTYQADITVAAGYDETAKRTEAQSVVLAYIQALGIGEDFIVAESIQRIMDLEGLVDVQVTTPAANLPIADYQKATSTLGSITIS